MQLKQGQKASREDILKFMDGKIAKWWMPDDVAFVDGIPHTATGKILKTALRDQFKATVFRTLRREELFVCPESREYAKNKKTWTAGAGSCFPRRPLDAMSGHDESHFAPP